MIQCQFIIDTLYLIVSSGNSQNISGDRPADVPNNIIELMEQFGRPGVSCRIVTRPDKHTSVLNKVQRKQLTKKCIRLNALYSTHQLNNAENVLCFCGCQFHPVFCVWGQPFEGIGANRFNKDSDQVMCHLRESLEKLFLSGKKCENCGSRFFYFKCEYFWLLSSSVRVNWIDLGFEQNKKLIIITNNKSHLGAAGDGAGGETNRWSPSDISHPITVSLQLLVLLPLTVFLSEGGRKQSVTVYTTGKVSFLSHGIFLVKHGSYTTHSAIWLQTKFFIKVFCTYIVVL